MEWVIRMDQILPENIDDGRIINAYPDNNRIFRHSPLYLEGFEGINPNRVFDPREPFLYSLSINVPKYCNFRCRKCFVTGDLPNEENFVSRDIIREIVSEAAELGARYIEISGNGEPLHSINFPWTEFVIGQARRNGMGTLIFTNGSLLTPGILNYFARNYVSLMISIDTLDSDQYRESTRTGVGMFDRVLENIEIARRIYAPYIEERNGIQIMRCGLNTTLTQENLEQPERIRRLAGGDLYYHVAPLAEGVGCAAESQLIRGELQEIYRVINQHSDPSIIVFSTSPLGFPICGTMYHGLAVNIEDGSVPLDAHFCETSGLLGNAKDPGFSLEKAIELRNRYLREFYERTGSRIFCPMRSQHYREFVDHLRERGVLSE